MAQANQSYITVTRLPASGAAPPLPVIFRLPLKSSNIRSAGYHSARCELEIEFGSGGIYRYADVPPETYIDLKAADSPGRYFAAHIRGRFSAQKMPGGAR